MNQKLPITFKEIIPLIESLKKRLNLILVKLNLPEGDVRRSSIVEIRTLCNTLGAVTIRMHLNFEDGTDETRIEIGRFLGIFDQPIENIYKGVLDPFSTIAKASFLVMAQFSLENAIAKILKAMGHEPKEQYIKNVSSIIHHANISNAQEKIEILNIAATLRNSLHRNGYHTKPDDTPIVVDGVIYDFKKDQKVQCASWAHILHLFMHILIIYEELVFSRYIIDIKYIPK